MGASKKTKQKFLSENPTCCFCGGESPSEEPDHIPSRALFLNRQWPEGYEFPACVKCNRVSRYDETVVAMLSRMYPEAVGDQEKMELEKFVKAVDKNIPEVITELRTISAARKKRLANKYGTSEGQTSRDIPFFSLDGKRTNEAILNFSRKLFLALYYKHANIIFPKSGRFSVMWYSNVQISDGEMPEEILEFLNGVPSLERNSKNLDDQFNYKYHMSECCSNTGFIVSFRQSFHILAYMNNGSGSFNFPEDQKVMRPYEWDSNMRECK